MSPMKPRNFEVGDRKFVKGERVAIYGAVTPGDDWRGIGVVVDHDDSGLVCVNVDGIFFYAHPKQLRRLKKRERRRVWIHTKMDDEFEFGWDYHPELDPKKCGACQEFVEIARPKKARG